MESWHAQQPWNMAPFSVSHIDNVCAAPLHWGFLPLRPWSKTRKSSTTHQAWEVLASQRGRRTHLTEERKLVIGEKPVGLIQEKISADEFFESPVFALHKPICPLTLWEKNKAIFRVTQETRSDPQLVSVWSCWTCKWRLERRREHLPIALVSSPLAFRMENLNFARTSLFGQLTSNR